MHQCKIEECLICDQKVQILDKKCMGFALGLSVPCQERKINPNLLCVDFKCNMLTKSVYLRECWIEIEIILSCSCFEYVT